MFVLGIFVGRKNVPVRFHIKDIKKELASLKNSDARKVKLSKEKASSKKKEGLGFYEDLKENETIPSSKVRLSGKKQKNITKSSHSNTPSVDTKKPGKEKQSKPVRTKVRFTIQVSSVKDEATAARLVADLKKQGYQAYTIQANIPELGLWHRVRIGHYSSKDKAASTIERLKKKAFKPILLQE